MRPLPLLLLLLLLATLSIAVWIASREPAAGTRLGSDGRPSDGGPWWLTVAVVESPTGTPVADTPLTFRLWRDGHTEHVVSVEQTTDSSGRVRLGPLPTSLVSGELLVAAKSARYELARTPAEARVVSQEAHTLRATCEMVRISVVSGRVDLPPDAPAEGVVLWRQVGPDLWDQVEVATKGRFTSRGHGPGPAVFEAAAAWRGRRWYGRAKVDEGARDVRLRLSDVRPGDPALLRLHLVGPEGEPATGVVTTRLKGALTRTEIGFQCVRASGWVTFLYEPGRELEVEVEGIDPGGLASATLGPVGPDTTEATVRLPRAPEGSSEVSAGIPERYYPRKVVRPSSGLPLQPALVVHVLDWAFEDRGAWACVVRDRVIVQHTRLDAEGVARFDRLPSLQECQVWVSRLRGNRYVWVKSLSPDAKEIEVRPQAGGVVQGTVRFPEGRPTEDWLVHAPGPGVSMAMESFAVGSFEVRQEGATFVVSGVPPGSWEFSLLDRRSESGEWIYFEAHAGEHVVVEVAGR